MRHHPGNEPERERNGDGARKIDGLLVSSMKLEEGLGLKRVGSKVSSQPRHIVPFYSLHKVLCPQAVFVVLRFTIRKWVISIHTLTTLSARVSGAVATTMV